MSHLLQVLLNGLINGLMISTLALGFAVVYIPTKTFYIALGAIYAGVPFLAMTFFNFGWYATWAIIAAVLSGVTGICAKQRTW